MMHLSRLKESFARGKSRFDGDAEAAQELEGTGRLPRDVADLDDELGDAAEALADQWRIAALRTVGEVVAELREEEVAQLARGAVGSSPSRKAAMVEASIVNLCVTSWWSFALKRKPGSAVRRTQESAFLASGGR